MTATSPDGWEEISLDDAGFAPDVVERIDAAFEAGKLKGLHGVVAIRRGRIAIERYYAGEDNARGQPLGEVAFGPETLHDLRSVSKSVVSLLYGIGLAAGEVPAPETPLAEVYPELLAEGDARRAITIGQVLTMTLGLAWDESLPYHDPRNSEIAMDMAADRVRFLLEQPLVEAPGSRWVYNGGATALLGRLIARGAGCDLLAVARQRLLGPLGIERAEWLGGCHEEPAAASGLRLRPRDLAKIGQLVIQEGRWGDRQVVPRDWLAESFVPRVDTGEGLHYGYQWWLGKRLNSDQPWYGAFGNGGQRLTVIPSLDFALVVTAGNYNRDDAWQLPVAIIADYVGPAIVRL